ncbi:MAG TPA: FHA domain-containing protein [Dyella sp.]|nr:FHA domain-containing protein [Dyella sp.]
MRIEFPHAAREDVLWDSPVLTIGSAPDNAVVLAPHQAAAHHLRLSSDRRGCLLQVLPGASRIYVNARPVRERALLRAGDVLSVGDCRMLLKADQSPEQREPLVIPEQSRCPVALRAVAGPLSGRVFALREQLELGPQSAVPLELPQGESASLRLYWQDGQLRLAQQQASDRYPLRINGRQVADAALQPGDQLGLATHRFIVDAPGMQPEPELPALSNSEPLPEELAGPRGEVWWLIVTAAVLALGIALVLLVRL